MFWNKQFAVGLAGALLTCTACAMPPAFTDVSGPFHNRIDSGRPTSEGTGDAPMRNDYRHAEGF